MGIASATNLRNIEAVQPITGNDISIEGNLTLNNQYWIKGVKDPATSTGIITKSFADSTYLNRDGTDTMAGSLDMGDNILDINAPDQDGSASGIDNAGYINFANTEHSYIGSKDLGYDHSDGFVFKDHNGNTGTIYDTRVNQPQFTVTAGTDLSGGGTANAGGSVTVNHGDTSSQGNVDTSGGTIIDNVNVDGRGHVTGMGTRNIDSLYLNRDGTDSMSGNLDMSGNNINNVVNITSPSGVTHPRLVLHSSSNNDNWGEQGAHISIGESGDLGNAALHMTYRGDGYGFIGSGSVSNAEPGSSYFRFDYNNDQIYSPDNLQVATIDTGHGNYEIGQHLRTSDSVTFGGITSNGNLDMSNNAIQNADWSDANDLDASGNIADFSAANDLDSNGNIADFSAASDLDSAGDISSFDNANDLDASGNIADFSAANDLDSNGNVAWGNAADLDASGNLDDFGDAADLNSAGTISDFSAASDLNSAGDISSFDNADDLDSNGNIGLVDDDDNNVRFDIDGTAVEMRLNDNSGEFRFVPYNTSSGNWLWSDRIHYNVANRHWKIRSNLNMDGSNINNIGGLQNCGGNQFVDGNGNCDTDTDTQLSETTVEQYIFDNDNDEGGMNIGGNLDMNGNTIDDVHRIGDDGQGKYFDFSEANSYIEAQDSGGSRINVVTQDTYINEDGFWLGAENLVNIGAGAGLGGGGTNGLTDQVSVNLNAGYGVNITADKAMVDFGDANDLDADGDISSFDNANDLDGSGNIADFSAANDLDSGGNVVRCNGDSYCDVHRLDFSNQEQPSASGGRVYFDENYYGDFSQMSGDGGGMAVYSQDGWGAVYTTANDEHISPTFASNSIGGSEIAWSDAGDLDSSGNIADFSAANDLDSNGNVNHGLGATLSDGNSANQNIDMNNNRLTSANRLQLQSDGSNNGAIYFSDASDWTGNAGSSEGKIEHHSGRFYINSGDSGGPIVQFRNSGGSGVMDIQDNGNLDMRNNQISALNQVNFNGGAWIDEGTAQYGNIRLDGGEEGGYGGINVQGNRDIVIGMTDADGSGFSTGVYDDDNNNWIWHYDGSSTDIRYNGNWRLQAESYGVNVNTGGSNSDGYRLDGNAALTTDGNWLRLNQQSSWNNRIYTPSVFRADGEIRANNGVEVEGSDRHAYNGISSTTANNGHLMLDSNGGNLYLNWDEGSGDVRLQGSQVRIDSSLNMNGNAITNTGSFQLPVGADSW